LHCLVLGGTGFIGSHVVENLASAGHHVRLLDLHPKQFWTPPPQVECVWTDWNDSALLDQAVRGTDIVMHLIGTTLPVTSNLDIVADIESNLVASIRLLQICRQHNVQKVVFSSSGGTVYGVPQSLPIHEDHPTYPINSYGVVKLAIEKYLHVFNQLYGLGYIVLRGANPYGQRQSPLGSQGAVSVFLNRLAQSKPIEIWGDGSVVRDFVHVSDLARAFRLAAESDLNHGIFNVGSGQGISLLKLIEKIQSATGQSPTVVHLPGRSADVPINVLDIRRIQARLGWQPTIDLDAGLKQMWDWIRSIN